MHFCLDDKAMLAYTSALLSWAICDGRKTTAPLVPAGVLSGILQDGVKDRGALSCQTVGGLTSHCPEAPD